MAEIRIEPPEVPLQLEGEQMEAGWEKQWKQMREGGVA
jgi:hypothetical protein